MEKWDWVPGYEGRYQVSNQGRVRSFLFSKTGKIMKLYRAPDSYPRVRFQFSKTAWLVHRLVAAAFIPNPSGLPVVNHKDGDKQNCRAENLEWLTHSDNMRHSWSNLQTYKNRVAVSPRGEANHGAKLTDAKVREIRALHAKGGISHPQLAARYGVSKAAIGFIIRRRNWKHVA